jgi:hypothetical protein
LESKKLLKLSAVDVFFVSALILFTIEVLLR